MNRFETADTGQENIDDTGLEKQKQAPIETPGYILNSDKYEGYKNEYMRPDGQEVWQNFIDEFGQELKDYFKSRGLPEELVYIAYVESTCRIDSVNPHSGTAGAFQLEENTAESWGLKVVQGIIDERKDPIKSAIAVACTISDAYDSTYMWEPPNIPNEEERWGWAILSHNRDPKYVKQAFKSEEVNGDITKYIENLNDGEHKEYLYKFYAARDSFKSIEPETEQYRYAAPVIYKDRPNPTEFKITTEGSITEIARKTDRTRTRIIAENLKEWPNFNPKHIGPEARFKTIKIPRAASGLTIDDPGLSSTELEKFRELNPHIEGSKIPETIIYFPTQEARDQFYANFSFESELIHDLGGATAITRTEEIILVHAGRML